MVKWSASSPSALMIRVRIPLTSTVFFLKIVYKEQTCMKYNPGMAHSKRTFYSTANCVYIREKERECMLVPDSPISSPFVCGLCAGSYSRPLSVNCDYEMRGIEEGT